MACLMCSVFFFQLTHFLRISFSNMLTYCSLSCNRSARDLSDRSIIAKKYKLTWVEKNVIALVIDYNYSNA